MTTRWYGDARWERGMVKPGTYVVVCTTATNVGWRRAITREEGESLTVTSREALVELHPHGFVYDQIVVPGTRQHRVCRYCGGPARYSRGWRPALRALRAVGLVRGQVVLDRFWLTPEERRQVIDAYRRGVG